jgi:hypothetical protein
MVATNNLQIEKLLKYDIACMYEWCTNVCKTQESYDSLILDLCNTFSFKHPSSRFVCSDNSWANDYHLTEKKLACPFYNPGVIFMKEELTSEFAKRYKQLWSLGASQKLQVGMSIAMQELTTNIGTLEPGTNMLPYLLTSSDKFKNFRNTYLLHCCLSSYDMISKLCDFYVRNRTVLEQRAAWEGEEYYFNQALKSSASSKKWIRDIDGYYNRMDINIHTEGM